MRSRPLPPEARALFLMTEKGPAALVYRENPPVLVTALLPWPEAQGPPEILNGLAGEASPPPIIRELGRLFTGYFRGNRVAPPWEILDLSPLTPLQRRVLEQTAEIPHGETRAYSDVARAIGRPGASRFVGSALAQNPFPVFIPCHRVVRKNGAPGRFGGGTALKEWMIHLESA